VKRFILADFVMLGESIAKIATWNTRIVGAANPTGGIQGIDWRPRAGEVIRRTILTEIYEYIQ
jgi:hypothetical protein